MRRSRTPLSTSYQGFRSIAITLAAMVVLLYRPRIAPIAVAGCNSGAVPLYTRRSPRGEHAHAHRNGIDFPESAEAHERPRRVRTGRQARVSRRAARIRFRVDRRTSLH